MMTSSFFRWIAYPAFISSRFGPYPIPITQIAQAILSSYPIYKYKIEQSFIFYPYNIPLANFVQSFHHSAQN